MSSNNKNIKKKESKLIKIKIFKKKLKLKGIFIKKKIKIQFKLLFFLIFIIKKINKNK